MKRQRDIMQIKEQGKNSQDQVNEEQIGKLPKKDFSIKTEKMIQRPQK